VADAREAMLARIRAALADVAATECPDDVAVPRDYRLSDGRSRAELAALFAQRVSDYRARVHRCSADALRETVALAAHELGLTRAAVAPGVPARWLPPALEAIPADGLTVAALDDIDAAITGCAAAIAETGTIILDGGPESGRRALTLVPDRHLCVVRAEQIHGQLPEALAAIADAVTGRGAPVTLISGPSASSDIELERVEGVHGPRRLSVVIAG
jgi:L-lactate dehydrogenase complex protein LldG